MASNPETPSAVRGIELISIPELQEIRRIWVSEKREIEDLVPKIYEEEVGKPYPGLSIDENLIFDQETFKVLKDICNGDRLLYETTRNLLDVERLYRLKGARHGLFDTIESTIRSGFFEDEDDALKWHTRKKQLDEIDRSKEDFKGDEFQLTQPETQEVSA